MPTLLVTHPDCIAHDPGRGHPEAPGRLSAIMDIFREAEFAAIMRQDAPLGSETDIARVHQPGFAGAVLAAVPANGHAALDADTILSPGSGHAALRAVGAVTSAVDAVMMGTASNAFCAVRPPGHHAE